MFALNATVYGVMILRECTPDKLMPLFQILNMDCAVMQAAVQIGVSKNFGHESIQRISMGQTGIVADYSVNPSQRMKMVL